MMNDCVIISRDSWYGSYPPGEISGGSYDAKVYREKYRDGKAPSCQYHGFTLAELLEELEPYSNTLDGTDRGRVTQIVIERRA